MFKKFDNISKIALINFFSTLYFYLPILTIYYQQRNLNFVQINSLLGIITASIFFAEIPTGLLADKFGRKISMVLALLFQLFGEIFFLFATNYLHFILISIIAGIGFAFQSGCSQALVYDSLKEEGKEKEMKKTAGLIGAFYQAGHLVGAFASSFIIFQLTKPRITLAIIMTIVSVGIAFLITFLLKEPQSTYRHSEKNPIELLKQSFSIMKNNLSLRRIILLGLVTTPFVGYLRNFQPPYFQLSHIPTMWLGISLGIAGILAMLMSKYGYKLEKVLGVNALFIGTLFPGIFYIFMSFIFSPFISGILFIINYGSMSLQEPFFADYYNIHIKSENRATTLSAINMFSSIYIALMGLVIGSIADVSLSYTFLFMAILIIVGSFLFKINKSHVEIMAKPE
ncbi:MAG: MFS transporter [Patescibacteria group bacterium]